MLKSIAKNSIIYYVSTLLTKGISFFLLPLYTSILSPENYGVLELLSIISTIVIIVFSLQINQSVARFYNELENQKEIKLYTTTVAIFAIFSFGIFTIIGLIFNTQISLYLNLNSTETILAILSITLNSLFYLSQNQLTWKIKPIQEMISSLAYNLITIGLTIYFLVLQNAGVSGIFKAQIIGATVGILIAIGNTHSDFGIKFSKDVLNKLLRFSLPLVPGALAIFIYTLTDRICIKELLGLNELGIYSVGNKITSILTIAGIGISSALSPLIFKHYKEPETPDKIALLFRIFSTLSFVLLCFLSFNSDLIITIMTNDLYLGAIPIIPFLLYAVFLNSLTLFFHGLLFAKKTMRISLIAISAGIINLVLNLIFIPKYGITAAAIATFISYGLNFFLLYTFSQREYYIRVSLLPLGIISILFFGTLYCSYYFNFELFIREFCFIILSLLSGIILLKKTDLAFINDKLKGIIRRNKSLNQ